MNGKKHMALLLGGVMAVSALAGCGGIDKDKTVAILNGEPVTLGIANFAARFQQAGYDDFYVAYFGEDVWSSDLYGNGSTMQETIKDSVMESLEDMYVLKLHMDEYDVVLTDEEEAAISDAAAAFLSDNSDDAIEALGATQEIVEEYLQLSTIQHKMYDAIIADADTEVTDEEAKTSAYSYVNISKTSYTDDEGNTVEYTEEELTELSETAESFAADAAADGLEEAAETAGYTVSSGTFTQDDSGLDEDVLAALKELGEGEVSGLIDTDSAYYVVRLDQEVDEEATEENRANIIEQRQSDLYDEVLGGWKEGVEWVVDTDVWDTVTFDNLFTTVMQSTETEAVEATEEATE